MPTNKRQARPPQARPPLRIVEDDATPEADEQIAVFAGKPLLGRDLLVGSAHLTRRSTREVLVIELASVPVDGRLYLPLHDVLQLARELEPAAPLDAPAEWAEEPGVGHA